MCVHPLRMQAREFHLFAASVSLAMYLKCPQRHCSHRKNPCFVPEKDFDLP